MLTRTSSDELNLSSRDLGRVESRQVRLSISIPALMFLTTMLVSLLLHVNVREILEEMPPGQTRSNLEVLSSILLWGGVGGAVAAGGVGVLLAWQIVRPLRALMRRMEEIAEGDLAGLEDIAQLGEIGTLGSAFNRMVDQLHVVFKQRDRQIRESAIGTVITLDAQGHIVATDSSFDRVLGLRPDAHYATPFISCLQEHDTEGRNASFIESLNRCLKDAERGLFTTVSTQYTRPDMVEPAIISVKVMPLDAADLSGPTVLVDLRDLTNMRGFYEQMQRADRLAAVGTLATGIAHEIRNPLASLRAMTQLMHEDSVRAGHRRSADDYLPRILREVDRLDRLVGSIKEFASQEQSPTVPVSLNDLLREAWQTARHRVELNPDIRLEDVWELDESLPQCPLEEARILQALTNLMVNALEAIREDEHATVAISSRFVEENHQRPIVLYIRNSFPEITRDETERLFEPFYTTKAEGTGLGLPIAYQIVTANSGVMEVHSDDGMFEVWLRFPLQGRHARIPTSSSSVLPMSREVLEPTA